MCDWYREVVQTYSETYGLKVDPHMDLIVANLLCGELRYVPGISPSSVPMGLFRPIGMALGWSWAHWDGYEVVLGP